jgi:hypothetical protein
MGYMINCGWDEVLAECRSGALKDPEACGCSDV